VDPFFEHVWPSIQNAIARGLLGVIRWFKRARGVKPGVSGAKAWGGATVVPPGESLPSGVGQGCIDTKHSTDVEFPPPTPRVWSIHPEGKSYRQY